MEFIEPTLIILMFYFVFKNSVLLLVRFVFLLMLYELGNQFYVLLVSMSEKKRIFAA